MKTKHLVLAGGGHSHLFVLKAFAQAPLPNVRITLVSPEYRTPYSGALSAWISKQADETAIYIDLETLARQANTKLITASVDAINPADQTLHLDNGEALTWDVLSLNTGSTPDLSDIRGAQQFACPVKPIAGFMTQWNAMMKQLTAHPEKAFEIAFIGAGVAGSELALTTANFLATFPAPHKVHLFADSQKPASGMPEQFQSKLSAALLRAGVKIHSNAAVREIMPDAIISDTEKQQADFCFVTTGASAPPWISASGLPCDPRGFLLVRNTLQSSASPAIFAAGDNATLYTTPVPKSGVYAVRMGPVLADNLKRFLQNQELKPYHPQKKALAILHTGQPCALAVWGNWSFKGRIWWYLKQWLDRRFVRLFS